MPTLHNHLQHEGSFNLLGTVIASLLLLIAFHPFIAAISTPYFGKIDDITLMLMYSIILFNLLFKNKTKKAFFYTLIWALLLIIISILFGANEDINDIIIQAILQTKLFLFCGFALLFISTATSSNAIRALIFLSILGGVINVIIPDVFHNYGLMERYRLEGSYVARIGGFQLNANRLGRILALVPLIGPAVLRLNNRMYYLLLAISAILLYYTGSRVSQLLFVIGIAYLFLLNLHSTTIKRIALVGIATPTLIMVIMFGAQELRLNAIDNNATVGDDAPIFRVVLLLEGAKLAADNFPLGTGLATYATPFAMNASVYQETKISDTFFFNQGIALYDNNFASILGETGWLGLLLIVAAYILIIDKSIKHTPLHFRLFFAVYITIIMFFESLMQNAITSACFALALAAISGHYRSAPSCELHRK